MGIKTIIFVVVVAKQKILDSFRVESQEERLINRVDIEAPALSISTKTFFIRFSHPLLPRLIFFLVNSLSRNRNFRNKIQNHGDTLAHVPRVCNTCIHILSRILPIKSAIRSQILLSLRYCMCICMYIRYC